jgi:hypothetical protein
MHHGPVATAGQRPWRRALGWLPVALLLVGVGNHLWQVQRHRLSPWLGAGFGMFATTDVGSARQVYLTAVLADGREQEITLGEPYRDTLKRARGLPSESWLRRLAEATFQALDSVSDAEFSAPAVALRVEIWRVSYRPSTLEPSASLLASQMYPFPVDGG